MGFVIMLFVGLIKILLKNKKIVSEKLIRNGLTYAFILGQGMNCKTLVKMLR